MEKIKAFFISVWELFKGNKKQMIFIVAITWFLTLICCSGGNATTSEAPETIDKQPTVAVSDSTVKDVDEAEKTTSNAVDDITVSTTSHEALVDTAYTFLKNSYETGDSAQYIDSMWLDEKSDSDGYRMNVMLKIDNASLLALAGGDEWEITTQAFDTMTKQMYEYYTSLGIYDVDVCASLKNEKSTDKILYMSLNGKTAYDVNA